ncbi:MAG: hypothetical protein Q9213_004293 [Squamulea squamosa]
MMDRCKHYEPINVEKRSAATSPRNICDFKESCIAPLWFVERRAQAIIENALVGIFAVSLLIICHAYRNRVLVVVADTYFCHLLVFVLDLRFSNEEPAVHIMTTHSLSILNESAIDDLPIHPSVGSLSVGQTSFGGYFRIHDNFNYTFGSDEGMYSAIRIALKNGDVFQKQLTLAAGFDYCFFSSPSNMFVSHEDL